MLGFSSQLNYIDMNGVNCYMRVAYNSVILVPEESIEEWDKLCGELEELEIEADGYEAMGMDCEEIDEKIGDIYAILDNMFVYEAPDGFYDVPIKVLTEGQKVRQTPMIQGLPPINLSDN